MSVQFLLLTLEELAESATNPRRRFDEAALAELTESIRNQGVLQPILVRPLEHPRMPAGMCGPLADYEIVAGHRRVRAARAAGLVEVPAMVRDLSDLEVLEMQLVENLQRADLSALDEAEGYRALADQHHMTVDAIASKIGKSREYVFGRMKLLSLGDEARAALEDGTIAPSVALLLARLPKVLQPSALDDIKPTEHRPEGRSARDAADFLRRQYMRPIKGAPFDPKAIYFQAYPNEAQVLAPKCADCEKRTKCAEDLFNADPKAPDMCMDGDCYNAKRAAQVREVVRKARADGTTIIEGKAAEKMLEKGWHNIKSHVVADHATWDFDDKYEQVNDLVKAAGEHCPAPELLHDAGDDDGYSRVFTLYRTDALRAALQKAGWFDREKDSTPKPGSAGGGSKPRKEDPKAKAAREAAELSEAVRMEILRAVRARMKEEIEACGGLPWEDVVRQILVIAWQDIAGNDASDALQAIYDVPYSYLDGLVDDPHKPLPDLFLALWTGLVAEHVPQPAQDRANDELLTTADRLGVDAAAIETRVKLERAAKEEKSEQETPPAATPAPKKGRTKRLKDLDQAELEAAATAMSGALELEA